uniref:Uncharacterized protein n=1 Tax=Ananas comosus var. bracteatus TaxID=296719 RepID=A0A6V7NVS2_ANACO|nr:unnamed protein product [Ananas comosus var. bracteatus]
MGLLFVESLPDQELFSCGLCEVVIASADAIMSTNFTGRFGTACLMDRVVNTTSSQTETKQMLTGTYDVSDIHCSSCQQLLGWRYILERRRRRPQSFFDREGNGVGRRKAIYRGISWDTNEDRLREYFGSFGEVVEAVIMRDRTTGRARGFGFIVFADPAVAERVVAEKHMIDGRMVEAKKAVPRDDQSGLSKSNSSAHGSPGPGRTKKIFVGGLASTVTEADFKKYFDQFGTITDVVVMYDHNTQRPRGFGFITYDSEDAVDKALVNTFHELNGKLVEVKRAVPKELSPGPTMRNPPIGGYSLAVSRANSFLSGYNPGYSPSSIGGYG